MEKIEKLLLLVVLGAAMIIMSVMSFGSEDPAVTPKDKTSAVIPGVGPGSSKTDEEIREKTRGLDEMVVDGPSTVAPGTGKVSQKPSEPITDSEKVGSVHKGAGEETDNSGPTGRPDTVQNRPMPVVQTAEFVLKPGEDPRIWIYEVQPNESMGGIATKLTGSQNNMYVIASFNEGLDLNRIRPGQEIQIPAYLIKDRKLVKDGQPIQGQAAGAAVARPAFAQTRRRVNPGMIPARSTTVVPTKTAARTEFVEPREATAARGPKTEGYRIRKGETLWAIAKRRVGERKAMAYVRQIQSLNPNLDPTNLQEREHILLPVQ